MRAQFWSFDVIFAVIIFSFAITVLALTWFNISNQLSLGYSNGSGIMQQQLQRLSQNLDSGGTPTDWENLVNVTKVNTWNGMTVGFTVFSKSSLSSAKVYAFMSMSDYNYQATKELLGVGFDYYITITSNPAVGSGINITMGRNPEDYGALTTYVATRTGHMNGIPITETVMLWTNTTLATS